MLKPWCALVLIIAPSACMSVGRPRPLIEDDALLDRARGAIDQPMALAPIALRFRPHPMSEPGPLIQENSRGRATLFFRPEIDRQELLALGQEVKEALDRAATRPVERIELAEGASLRALLSEAEARGASLLAFVDILANELRYTGAPTGALVTEWLFLTGVFPLHWWIPNERFEVERRARLRVYDVRDPLAPLFEAEITSRASEVLNEFQHGLILGNTVRALWDDGRGRFAQDNWQAVYEALAPRAVLAMQKDLIRALITDFKARIDSPDIKEALTNGRPEKARLYAIVVGQNGDRARVAAADAREVYELLRARAGVRPAHAQLLNAEVTRARLLGAIAGLSTKAVDRVLFFFAGEGRQDGGGQYLCLAKGEGLALRALAAAFAGVKAGQVAFILDASFGGPDAGRARSRTRPESLAALPAGRVHLAPLGDLERGWRVLASGSHDQLTGEHQGHGLLTGLLLHHLKGADGFELEALAARVEDRFARRSHAVLGGAHQLVLNPRRSRRRFALTPKTAAD